MMKLINEADVLVAHDATLFVVKRTEVLTADQNLSPGRHIQPAQQVQ